MRPFLAHALVIAICAGLLAMWSPYAWAAAAVQISVFAIGAGWAITILCRRANINGTISVLPLTGILAIGALQLVFGWTVYRWETRNALLYWFTNLLVLLITRSLADDPALRTRMLRWAFAFGVVLSIQSVIQVFTSDGKAFWLFPTEYKDMVLGPFVYRNQFAAFVEILLPIALVRTAVAKTGRWTNGMITGALYACAIASCSRAGALLATAEVITVSAALAVSGFARLRDLLKPFGAVLLLGGLFTAVVGPGAVWERLNTPDPYATRKDFFDASLAMFRDHPLRGFGLGTWPSVYPGYASTDDGFFANQAHNDWAQAAVEGGVPALACLALFFLWSLRASCKCTWGWGIPFVLIHAWVDYPIQRQALAAFFFFVAGILAASIKPVNPRSLPR